ncbi:MAG: hypothetical protein AAF824_20755 [Bacteroidota bacterium]
MIKSSDQLLFSENGELLLGKLPQFRFFDRIFMVVLSDSHMVLVRIIRGNGRISRTFVGTEDLTKTRLILLYLSETHLRDRLFVKDFVHNYRISEKAILIHDSFHDTVSDTRFVTKRLSSLLSEAMVYNNAFSSDQRTFFYPSGKGYKLNMELVSQLLSPIQLLILNPVLPIKGKPQLVDSTKLIQGIKDSADISELITFTDNPLSPLGRKGEIIRDKQDVSRLLKVYEEEKAALELAYSLRPARLASPSQYDA